MEKKYYPNFQHWLDYLTPIETTFLVLYQSLTGSLESLDFRNPIRKSSSKDVKTTSSQNYHAKSLIVDISVDSPYGDESGDGEFCVYAGSVKKATDGKWPPASNETIRELVAVEVEYSIDYEDTKYYHDSGWEGGESHLTNLEVKKIHVRYKDEDGEYDIDFLENVYAREKESGINIQDLYYLAEKMAEEVWFGDEISTRSTQRVVVFPKFLEEKIEDITTKKRGTISAKKFGL